jgi:signal transduction histidine kinase
MEDPDASAYLRLSQFLDLQRDWLAAESRTELCHRICSTAALLLDTPCIAFGLGSPGAPYEIVASEGDWRGGEAQGATGAGLLAAARIAGTPQLKSRGDDCLGVFPFAASREVEGCLYVRLPRPLFCAPEISFVRFLASLAGLVVRAWSATASSLPRSAPQPDVDRSGGCVPRPADTDTENESAARRYVAMAVHDLRNPLNVVAGYTALLDEESLGTLTAQQREAVEAIKRQARVLLTSVDQLIELDRVRKEAAQHSSRFEVGQLFDDLRATCFAHCAGRVRWPESEVAFDFDCDRRRLFSIAQNLIDNALKHTPGGDIVVECARSDRDLTLSVRDQGPGLDPELRAKLIDHAHTGAETAPRSGLGLYTLASHVHALGGAIDIQSASTGTNIQVTIPGCSASDTPVVTELRRANGSRRRSRR